MADGALTGCIAGQNTNALDTQTDAATSFIDASVLAEATIPLGGSYAKADTPISGPAKNGAVANSYIDDFYYRFHAIPREVNFGSVADDTILPFLIWNAFFTEADFDAVTEEGVSGVTIGGTSTGYTANPLELIEFTGFAPRVGPPTINSIFTFDLTPAYDSVQRSINVSFTGFRAVLPPWQINWSDNFAIEYEYRTEIITSRNGAEQRRANRYQPRRKVRYSAAIWNDLLRKTRGQLQNARLKAFAIPEATRKVYTTAAVAAGEQVLTFVAVPSWVETDRAVILSYADQRAIFTVSAQDATTVTLAQTNTLDWPVGSKIHPIITGVLSDPTSAVLRTNIAMTADIEIMETPGTPPLVNPAAATTTFNGREVFMRKPNWQQEPEDEIEHMRETVDFGFGYWQLFSPTDFHRATVRLNFTSFTEAQGREIIDLFDRMKGRQGEFYMPTWVQDIIPGRDFGGDSPVLYILGSDIAEEYGDSTTAKAIYIRKKDGTESFHQVTSIREVEEGGIVYTVLDFAESIIPDMLADDIELISWLYVWRFASDRLLVEWETDEVSICRPSFTILEDR